MTRPLSVVHDTWTLQREYAHPVHTVFRAWSDGARKLRWFDLSPSGGTYHQDFRVGGAETYRSPPGVSPAYGYDAVYSDIVPDARIVTAYTVTADGRRVSVSLATVLFTPTGRGTRLDLTEQGAFLDSLDTAADRRSGTVTQLEALDRVLAHDQGGSAWPSS